MRRPPATLADYLLVGINPALIMVMIASVVFFLVEVAYRGDFNLRIDFMFFMFIMGAVAVGRLSMEEGTGYAAMFGLPLALVTLVAIPSFVQFQGSLAALSFVINIGLIALIWWLAYKLTWDCTLLDEQADTSDQGLLEAVGISSDASDEGQQSDQSATDDDGAPVEEISPWLKWFERAKKPHAHGVWVIYFSLAALPLFGLGQWFLPVASRGFAFLLLVAFVASALALLMSTSFLGLRRYLRKRHLEMPAEMTATWLGVGGALIVAVLLVCLLLPRPGAEFAVSQLPFLADSGERDPNRVSVGNDGQKADENARASGEGKNPEEAAKSTQSGEEGKTPGEGSSQPGEKGEKQQSGGEEKSDQSQPNSSGQEPGEGQASEKSSGGDQKGKEGSSPASGEKTPEDKRPASAGKPSETTTSEKQQSEPGQSASPPPPPASSPPFSLAEFLSSLSSLLKLALYLAIAAILAFLAWRYRREIIAAWQQLLKELRELWQRLFGGRDGPATTVAIATVSRERPFAAFTNPFTSGQATRLSRTELVRYTFEAVQAWGREHGCPREPSETPHEYAQRLSLSSPHLAREATALAELYGLAAYASALLPDTMAQPLRSLWDKLSCVTTAKPQA